MLKKLKSLPLFSGVECELLERLIKERHIWVKTYHKGATVHEQNAECAFMDVISGGKLVAYSLAANGTQTVVFTFEAGGLVGANLLFSKQNRYPMNIYCTADCTLFHISKYGVGELLTQYNFVMRFVQSLSANSQSMNQKIAMYTQKTLRENLTDYFLALCAEQGSNRVMLPISKKQLADYFGVQRPSLFREIKKMSDEGLIEVLNRIITIKF